MEGGEAVNGGVALDQWVGGGGGYGLKGGGDEEADDHEVELEVAEEGAVVWGGRRWERVVGTGGVGLRRLEVAAGGGDEVVEAEGDEGCGGEQVVHQSCHC